MPGVGGIIALVVVFGVLAPVALYALIHAEAGDREVMDREAAERTARRDVDDERR